MITVWLSGEKQEKMVEKLASSIWSIWMSAPKIKKSWTRIAMSNTAANTNLHLLAGYSFLIWSNISSEQTADFSGFS